MQCNFKLFLIVCIWFCCRLFDENPELLPLFPFADEDTPEKLRNSDRLRRHGIRVMTTIDEAIAGLDDMETVAARLSALGERHAHYEARKAHFQVWSDS